MDFSDLFSDDDEEIIEYSSSRIIVRQVMERSNLFDSLPEDKFVRRFRLTKRSTSLLLQQITSQLIRNTDRLV